MAVDLTDKLHPARFSEMSPLMAAIVGFVLGESFTKPTIAELTVSEHENLVYMRLDRRRKRPTPMKLVRMNLLLGTSACS